MGFFTVPTDAPWIMHLAVPVARVLRAIVTRPTVVGIEKIPASGPVIIAPNHTDYFDIILMGLAVVEAGRTPIWVSADQYFKIPVFRSILKAVNTVPVYRSTGHAGDAMAGMKKALEQGGCLVVFPEGMMSVDPQKWPITGKTGIARLSAMVPGTTILPAAQWGTERILEPWSLKLSWKWLRSPSTVVIGDPVNLGLTEDSPHGEVKAATERLMKAIEKLLVPLRQANPLGFTTEPRDVRWDKKRDGDPHTATAGTDGLREELAPFEHPVRPK
ncbi:1-acyl-sn-glycerol-3-phosphate acyltransferase [Arcanobacterium wilhelmae]|uniref:1-acyl-sn-glycerol-3-phosphate acyltransferase n=1 Tax=Arcanobacterium wilhelmae TaxID=1803177 RepID=A0ABT9ND44_9ACTO|nr:lysophospholipid acyltransferase family protein [Arcanobacterium wilhelmae]MDP9801613.1 1-acyl-sn-glycerol-3-phosphate acyltransferase [Arcanobacterium wilhelmae]WFN90936.1 lysophospholipid acyltransferase family protein [Arcanobacterium wilhelmae]